jgi:hypothetical protein
MSLIGSASAIDVAPNSTAATKLRTSFMATSPPVFCVY